MQQNTVMTRRSLLLWVFSVILMLAVAVYQRRTGPTYPVKGEITTSAGKIRFKLPRTHGGEGGEIIRIAVADAAVTGRLEWCRYKSHDPWTGVPLVHQDQALQAEIPWQPPAGKVQYRVVLCVQGREIALTENPVIIRFKGGVPPIFLVPHIVLAFLAMCLSTRTGIEALLGGKQIRRLSFYTCLALFVGGMILGPIIQKYAFGAFWTGWPLGHDLTDNKTAVAMVMWAIALYRQRKCPNERSWAIAASAALLAVYLVPHSVLGSEIDYTKCPAQ